MPCELAGKVRSDKHVVLLEVIAPSERKTPEMINDFALRIKELASGLKVDGINIPEVRNEKDGTGRSVKFYEKAEPRVFGSAIEKAMPGVEAVVNRCCVHDNHERQNEWLVQTWRDFGIKNLVLVGGESSRIRYPGPAVTEMARMVTNHLNNGFFFNGRLCQAEVVSDYFVGGIAIPTRSGEAARLMHKANHGIEFFTSQVIFEPESSKALLSDYWKICSRDSKRIFLSFAPVSQSKDIAFMRWLGVRIPDDVERRITGGNHIERSIEVSCENLRSVLEFLEKEGICVNIGVNVAHVMKYNVQASIELAGRLTGVLKDFKT